jgi:hypothetical protein
MADKVFLPNTVLEIVEKYPAEPPGGASLRLNHPDLSDVLTTDYCVGVISDFKVKSEDPFAVASMVKVKIDGKECDDYIPIFYHPKKGWWDDRGFRDELGNLREGEKDYNYATDFKMEPGEDDESEDYGYFEKAWMSFRCGDEVVVLLRPSSPDDPASELKPYAVVGFADGVHRPGENLFKWTGFWMGLPDLGLYEGYLYAFNSLQQNFSSSGTPYNTYPMGAIATNISGNGAYIIEEAPMPEGFDKEKVLVTKKNKTIDYLVEEIIQEEFGWYCVDRYIYDNWVMALFRHGSCYERHHNYDIYWTVGPLMFCQTLMTFYTLADGEFFLAVQHGSEWDPADFLRVMNPPVWPEWADDPVNLGFKPANITPCEWEGYLPIPTHPEMDPWYYSNWPTYERDEDCYLQNFTNFPDGSWGMWTQPLYCAVYTPELWESPDTSKMFLQENDFFWFSLMPRWVPSSASGEYLYPWTIEVFGPPHTKEELIEADMWPKESK